jgi:hypothetical protein
VAVPLLDGRVFVMGNGSAEAYDPVTGTWSAVALPSTPGVLSVTRVDGRLLFAGGIDQNGPRAMAEMYNASSGTWSPAGAMAQPRYYHQATLLPNGRVLISGGLGPSALTAELYTP